MAAEIWENQHILKRERGVTKLNRHEKAMELLLDGTIIPATPLALTEERSFDERTQRTLMRYYLDAGAGGIATAVHSTQFAIRKPEHKLFEPIIKLVSEEISEYERKNHKVVVKICGVCGEKEQAVSEAVLARENGYDAVLLSPGGLNHLSEHEFLERAKAVADEMPIIGFYLQQAVGGKRFSYEFWKKFCEIPNVAAIKCASFDRYTTIDVVRAVAFSNRKDQITLYTGNDDNLLIDLLTPYCFTENGVTYEARFRGGLLGHWCVWTKRAVELFEEVKMISNTDEIPAWLLTKAAEITDINGAFFDVAHDFAGCISGLHEILRRQGIFKNTLCLDPEEGLSMGQIEEIDRVYRLYPEWNDDAFVAENLATWVKG